MEKSREYDESKERVLMEFLDSNFYGKYVEDFERCSDKVEQVNGIDVKFSLGNVKNIKVDEKAQTSYVNKNLPTYAFELSFLNRKGDIHTGWFIDDTKETEYYFLMWITAKEEDFKLEDIICVEGLLVKRYWLHKYLEDNGLSIQEMKNKDEELRKGKLGGRCVINDNKDFYMYYSDTLNEKPVNVVIRKEVLEELAYRKVMIYQGYTKFLRNKRIYSKLPQRKDKHN